MDLVLVKKSCKVFPEEFVTLMSWDPRDFLSCSVVREAGYFTLFGSRGGGGGGGHFEVKEGHPDFFTNNMIFLECGFIALFEAFYMFRDHNHVKMKF